MKKALLIVLLSFFTILSMEQPLRLPQRGQKRWRQSLLVSEGNKLAAKIPSAAPRTAFEILPPEIKTHILSFLTTAKGATQRARLDNAAENIRTFFNINTQFKSLGDDPQIIEYLITQLANRYANGDKVAAAIALGTEAAGKWLKSKLLTTRSTESKWLPRTEAARYDSKIDEQFIDAASNGRIYVLKFLRDFVPFYTDLSWNAAFHIAVKRNQVEVMKFLLNEPRMPQDIKYELINDTDDEISPMALFSIQNNQEDMLDLLLKAGANIDTRDTNYDSPLELALHQKNPSLVRTVLKKVPELANEIIMFQNAEQTPLILAIYMDNPELVKILLEAGADVNFRTKNGTALEQAQELSFKKNNAEIIKLLKEFGA